jgi:hypothetical protein
MDRHPVVATRAMGANGRSHQPKSVSGLEHDPKEQARDTGSGKDANVPVMRRP